MKHLTGFTLIEILIVIAIIGILSGVVLIQFPGIMASARDAKRNQEVKMLKQALQMYADKQGGFSNITGLPANNCAGGNGWLVSNFPGYPSFCQAVFYSNDNNRPTGLGHNSWGTLQGHLSQFLPILPNDPKNAYRDWQHYPASPAVCPSGCNENSPLTDGFLLVVVTSINLTMDICGGDPATIGYSIHTALENKNNSATLVNQGYNCFNVGSLKNLKVNWGEGF